MKLSGISSETTTLVTLLLERAQVTPHQLAYRFLLDGEEEAEEITYQQLHQQACSVALAIQEVAPSSDKALLMYGSGLDFIVAFFGCLYAGRIAVPMYMPPRQRKLERLRWVMQDAETELVLSTDSIRDEVEAIAAESGEALSVRWLTTQNSQADQFRSISEQLWTPSQPEASDIAFLQYSSGSTSFPKAVMVSHANIMANEKLICAAFRLNSDTRAVTWLPHYHDMGLIGTILQPVYYGIPCTLMSPMHFIQKPIRWLQAISRFQATISGGPDFAYDLCASKIKDEQLSQLDLGKWCLAFTGSEVIREHTLYRFAERFRDCGFNPSAFYPCYGLAESTLFVTGNLPGRTRTTLQVDSEQLSRHLVHINSGSDRQTTVLVGCGTSWPGHELLIVNPDTSIPCETGSVGEVWVRGPSVAKGYWKQPELTSKVFHATVKGDDSTTYLRTGDLGFIHKENLYITGRIKDLIIIRGQNYYPSDIELTVAKSADGLLQNAGAAFSIEHENDEKLVVVQEVDRSHLRVLAHERTIEGIRSSVLRHHGIKVHAVSLLKPRSIPKTSSGKIRRSVCKVQFISGDLSSVFQWSESNSRAT